MTFKGALFCLFLYVALVWVGATYLYSGPRIQEVGLLWTAAGLLFVLALVLLSKIWAWMRALRARTASKPKAAPKVAAPLSEEESAIRALLDEARATLGRFPGAGKHLETPLSSLPLYLLIGPEGSGKTNTFMNSGLEPQLLAGDAVSSPTPLPTRFCNLWLAKDVLFLEIGGRLFNGDPGRWQRVLKALQARPATSFWRQLWQEPERGFECRGVVAFCDVKNLMTASSPQGRERLDAHCRDWQERLGTVTEAFSAELPVYLLITKCDALPYFSDFFRRLPEAEIGQVLGATFSFSELADLAANPRPMEAEAKRFTKSFSALYQALADRRILHLFHEPDALQRPGIYEFPREFKRIRTAAVQFLSTVFRPNALRLNPRLRGYYLSGICERPAVALAAAAQSGTSWSDQSQSLEATGLFRGEATQIFRPSEQAATPKTAPQGGLVRRWAFVSELFQNVLLADAPAVETAVQAPDKRVERFRAAACLATCAICLAFCVITVRSLVGNSELLQTTGDVAERHIRGSRTSLEELQSLERLRLQTSELLQYEHEGAPLRLRWGLYAGNRVAAPTEDLYFHRFQELLLDGLNGAIVAHLLALPPSPGPDDPYNPAFRLLKAHLMITSGSGCSPDPAFVASALRDVLGEITPAGGGGANWDSLAAKQIGFYAGELPYGNPCKLAPNPAARDRARQYLAQIQGVDRIYSSILGRTEKAVPKAQRLADLSPNYAQVLSGPGEVSGAFTRDGWTYVENASKKAISGNSEDACVLGQDRRFGAQGKQASGTARGIQRMFIRDYADRWRRFVAGFSVKPYGSAADAAQKLELLSSHKSPLLALFAMTSDQTNFAATVAEPEVLDRVKPVVKKLFPSIAKGAKTAAPAAPAARKTADTVAAPVDITAAFQPVHWVVPAGSETWVGDKNSAYIDSLAQLGHSMEEIARSANTPDPAVFQAATQNYDKALDAARQIARGFEPVGVAGLDVTVERLLEAPIRLTNRFIVTDLDSAAAGKVNGELRAACARMSGTLHKYPFRPSREDATLEEVGSLFAPGNGIVWKFQAQCLAELTVKEGSHWNVKDPAKKPRPTPEMLAFLSRAQGISDVFYPAGSNQPQFSYTLRPKADPTYKDAVIELEVDGQTHAWTSSLQKQFTWPAPAGNRAAGAVGRIKSGSLSFPFASRGGVWGIFRMMGDAEPRPLGSKTVEWKYVRGGDGRLEEIQPAPVRLEIVEFPGGLDVFNPRFFDGLQCPAKAVE